MGRLNSEKNISTDNEGKFRESLFKSDYFAPQSLQEALELLEKYGEDVVVLAGGTDLLVQYYDRLYEVKNWLDLGRLEILKNINLGKKELTIGAMVSHAQIEKSQFIQDYFPILSNSAADIGSPQIKNRGTIGGNIVNASPAGDLLPSLMAYGAMFKLISQKEEKIVPAVDFFIGPKKTILGADQLLSQVILPLPGKHTYGSWTKIGKRRALIIATITLALLMKMDNDDEIIEDISVCLGSVAPTPIQIKEIKAAMIGKKLQQLNFSQLGQLVKDKIHPIDDIRGTREYRKDVARQIMIKALEEVAIKSRRAVK